MYRNSGTGPLKACREGSLGCGSGTGAYFSQQGSPIFAGAGAYFSQQGSPIFAGAAGVGAAETKKSCGGHFIIGGFLGFVGGWVFLNWLNAEKAKEKKFQPRKGERHYKPEYDKFGNQTY